jgi:threonine dehydratase
VEHVDVTDDAIIQAQLRAWEELHVGLEAGGAAALAALLSGAYVPAEREVAGVLACGGNVDIATVLAAAA